MQFSRKSRSLRAARERGWAWEKGVDGCPGFRESGKKEPRKVHTSKKNENPEVTSRIETSRLGTQRDIREKSSAFSCL
jgi:hypothetical protein